MSDRHSHREEVTHGKAFVIGIILNVIFVLVEAGYGVAAGSSALLADAGHNASDVLSLLFAWGAAWLATKEPKGRYTYGLRKSTVLASILNALLLFGAMAYIAWDAIKMFTNPKPIEPGTVMAVAGIGIVINTATALLFFKGSKEDLNIRGAFLHMAADAGVSLGVVVAGLIIYITGYTWIDPIISFGIIAIVLWSGWKLFIESLNLALDAVPKGIDLQDVHRYLESVEGVEGVHDLHIWALSTSRSAMTAHLVVPNVSDTDTLMETVRRGLREKFNIGHSTLQLETVDFDDALDNHGHH